MSDRKGVDPDRRGGEEELGGADGGETNHDVLCERKKSIFNLKKRSNPVVKFILSVGFLKHITIMEYHT